MNDDLKKWLPWIGGAAVLLIIVAVFFLTTGGGDEVAATTTTGDSTTTAPASTTSEATTTMPATTTVPPTTTLPPTTTVPATTTVPPTTLPPSTTVPPTTTVPDPPLGELELDANGVLAFDDVPFGMIDDAAVVAVTDSLGPNTRDTGWIDSFSEYGTCPGDEVRGVEWGSFVMLFTKADTAFATGGTPHFFSYYYNEPAQPGFATPETIEIGSTVGELKGAYDGPDFDIGEAEFDPSSAFWIYRTGSQMMLWGYATGQADSDTVGSLNGGIGCGE